MPCPYSATNMVDWKLFFYNSLPVVQGAFTLGQALGDTLASTLTDTTIVHTDLDTLEHVPCSALYVLSFGNHQMYVVRDCTTIAELYIHDTEIKLHGYPQIPVELLHGIRVRVANGQICDKDGLLYGEDKK